MSDFRRPDWWDNRVKELKHNLKDLIFLNDHREEYWRRVDELLSLYKDKKVLDVCCGYGRFSNFKDYTGIDFSSEMLKLAKEQNPDKNFILHNGKDGYKGQYDIVFEVNSLHSLGITPEEFYDLYKDQADYVMCLERNIFYIYNNYESRKSNKG